MRQLSYRRKIRCSYSFMKVISMAAAILLLVVGCTTTNIDETRQGYTGIEDHESVVVLGRRHKGDYDTEIDFIQCVGSSLEGKSSLDVVPEQEFTDRLDLLEQRRPSFEVLNHFHHPASEAALLDECQLFR